MRLMSAMGPTLSVPSCVGSGGLDPFLYLLWTGDLELYYVRTRARNHGKLKLCSNKKD